MSVDVFDLEAHKVKAVLLADNETVVNGHIGDWANGVCVWTEEYDVECDDYFPQLNPVNTATVCRNTGKKINGQYLYEFDLIERQNGTGTEIGFVLWADRYCGYRFCVDLDSLRTGDMNGNLKILGNIILSDADYKKMREYQDERDNEYHGISTSNCSGTREKFARRMGRNGH